MKFNDENMLEQTLIKSENIGTCTVCGESTYYIDYCYETRVCSIECLSVLDKQAEQYCNKYCNESQI